MLKVKTYMSNFQYIIFKVANINLWVIFERRMLQTHFKVFFLIHYLYLDKILCLRISSFGNENIYKKKLLRNVISTFF